MIGQADARSFQKLRERIFSLIEKALEEGEGYKSYEGQMSIDFPGYADDQYQASITLHCYVLGVGKHHTWTARNMQEALVKAWADIERWESSDGDDLR